MAQTDFVYEFVDYQGPGFDVGVGYICKLIII